MKYLFVLNQQVEESDFKTQIRDRLTLTIDKLHLSENENENHRKSQRQNVERWRSKAQLETEVSSALINQLNCTTPDFHKASQLNCEQTLDENINEFNIDSISVHRYL
jgi:hypothetical protein